MIAEVQTRSTQSNGLVASRSFEISSENSAHIMTILRDTLYSDKILAVLREYGANGWDAHCQAGKKDVPIKITLPTLMDPTLTIRDFGPGLSHEDAFNVYTQYGASTKRGTNEAVGHLGIGSKSGFAYAESFTVTSWHEGMMRVYIAALDESNKGIFNLLAEEACPIEETGVQIQIPVKTKDIEDFKLKAQALFRHFTPQPQINTTLPAHDPNLILLNSGALNLKYGPWVAVMGCIPYRINLEQIRNLFLEDGTGVGDWVLRTEGMLNFNIGEVQISSSREELRYTEATRKALVRKFQALIGEYMAQRLTTIEASTTSNWERRLQVKEMQTMGLPIPKAWAEFCRERVKFGGEGLRNEHFRLLSKDGSEAVFIDVLRGTILRMKDDDRALTCFQFPYNTHEYLIARMDPKTPWDVVHKALAEALAKEKLDGVPLGLLSSVPWQEAERSTPSRVRGGKQDNVKHKRRTFKLNPTAHFGHPWSGAWEVEDRVPEKDDVYVILTEFKVRDIDFYKCYRKNENLAKFFGPKDMTLPTIYGYKSTESKPVKPEDIEGIPFLKWQADFTKSLIKPEILEQIKSLQYAEAGENIYDWNHLTATATLLGDQHPLILFLSQVRASLIEVKKMAPDYRNSLKTIARRVGVKDEVAEVFKCMQAKYPLIMISGGFVRVTSDSDYAEWVKYIQMVDAMSILAGATP